jgi:DNA-binding beta-propeller fold protein YncE
LALAGFATPARGSIPEDLGPLWAARYDGPASSGDDARSLAVSPDGSKVFVTGCSDGCFGTPSDFATLAYDAASGAQLWAARYNGPANSDDDAPSLAVSPDGSKVFVTGSSVGSGTSYDYATLAYSAASGAQLWAARYNAPANSDDVARSLAVSPDGSKVFVTGESWDSGAFDYATVAYSAASGAQLWAARYDGPASSGDGARSLAVSPDGSKVFVTGVSWGSGAYEANDYATVAYSAASGSQLWAARYNGPANSTDYAHSLAVSPDGSKVFVTGLSFDSGSYYDYATVAYSAASGSRLWAARYNGPANSYDVAHSLAVSPDGSKVFVTGESGSGSSTDYATVAYLVASGSQLWAARYNGSANNYDVAESVAVSPDGSKVFVTGGSVDSGSSDDYATVAYSVASGFQFWVALYNGPANIGDYASSLAVSPDGSKVFVTGFSGSAGSGTDYATVAYTTCAAGRDEAGPVSGPIHGTVEPQTGPAAPYVHGVNCDVVTANGL